MKRVRTESRSPRGTALLLTCLLALGLAGCFGGSKRTLTIRTYQLDYDPPAVAGETLPVVVQLAAFRITATYDRQAIIYRDSRHTTDSYFYHRWAAHPAKMMTDLLTRDLARSGRYQAVQQGPSLLAPDYLLQGEVEEIEERAQSGSCAAHLRLAVLVSRPYVRNAPVVWQKTYSHDEPCPCNAPAELAEAMSRATAVISEQLQNELAESIGRDLAGKHRD